MAAEKARASFDHRHRFVANVTYEVPTLRALGSGWRVSAIATLESGAPFTVNLGTDVANIGAGPAQRPNMVCDPNEGGAKSAAQWFNTSCFTLPAAFTFGNAPRNPVLSPGYAQIDLAVQKGVELRQGLRVELRLDVFNLLDRTNFDVPNRIAFTPNFGRIFSAKPARQMQVGAKMLF